MSNETTTLYISPSDRLATYFIAPYTNQQVAQRAYTDSEIQQISNLLKHYQTTWSRYPRTYIVLRTIGQLELLNELIELGFTDHWFPVEARSLPQTLRPFVRAAIVKAQSLVITKSVEIEKGENGRHGHFGKGDPLPFEIKGKLGSGGFSQVDRIASLISYKEYALKRMRRRVVFGNESREAFKRFKAEVEIVKSLKHHHMVEFVGSYTDPTYLGFIMSPIADTDLSKYLKSISDDLSSGKSPLEDLSNLRSYFGCLVNALQYLHDQSIRHKDIKPQNILIASGNVLFTDFGLSRNFMDATGSTTSGMTYMTPRYSAPEVAAYDARNTSADIWSLGCVFLEMILVLKRLTLDSMKDFFERNGTHEPYINCNMEASSQWISKLETLESSSDNEPLDWVKQMLVQNRHSRATAAQLFTCITNGGKHGRPDTMFCGICCLVSGESDSHDSLDEEFAETSRTESCLPSSTQFASASYPQLAQPTSLPQEDFPLNSEGMSIRSSDLDENSENLAESTLRPTLPVPRISSDLNLPKVGASLDSPKWKPPPGLPTAYQEPEHRIDRIGTTERRPSEVSNESIKQFHDNYSLEYWSNSLPYVVKRSTRIEKMLIVSLDPGFQNGRSTPKRHGKKIKL